MEFHRSAVVLLLLFGSCCGSGGGLGTEIETKMLTIVDFPEVFLVIVLPEVGKQTFFKSPPILGLIPIRQIRKFLRCASPQIASPQIFYY